MRLKHKRSTAFAILTFNAYFCPLLQSKEGELEPPSAHPSVRLQRWCAAASRHMKGSLKKLGNHSKIDDGRCHICPFVKRQMDIHGVMCLVLLYTYR